MDTLLAQLEKLVELLAAPSPDAVLGKPTFRGNGLTDWKGAQLKALGADSASRATLVRIFNSRETVVAYFPFELVAEAEVERTFGKGRKRKNLGLVRSWTFAGVKRELTCGTEGVVGHHLDWKVTLYATPAEVELARSGVTAAPPVVPAKPVVVLRPPEIHDVSGAELAFLRFIEQGPGWVPRSFADAVAVTGAARQVVPVGARGEVLVELHATGERLSKVELRVDFNDVDQTGLEPPLFRAVAEAWKRQASALAKRLGLARGRVTRNRGEWEGQVDGVPCKLEFETGVSTGAEGSYGSAHVWVGPR